MRLVVPNKDLFIADSAKTPWLAVCCRWKDAHSFSRRFPQAAIVGPLRTVRGIDLLFRTLLANPQITVMMVRGTDLTPNEQTTDALKRAWKGDNTWLLPDVIEHADSVRYGVILSFDEEIKGPGSLPRKRVILPPPKPAPTEQMPHGDPGQRIVGQTIEEVWPKALQQAIKFGRKAETKYGETKEVLNLVTVLRDPELSYQLPEWIPGNDQVDAYSDRLFRHRFPPEDTAYSYSSRLHHEEQISKVAGLLTSVSGTRAAFLSPWQTDTDGGKESGRPCLVGVWFRSVVDPEANKWECTSHGWSETTMRGEMHGSCPECGGYLLAEGRSLHLTVMFRSHDLFGAYPLNLAAACVWLTEEAKRIGAAVGTLTCLSCSAHVYDRDYVDAEKTITNHWPSGIDFDMRSTWRVEKVDGLLRASTLTPDGKKITAVFDASTPQGLRSKIEKSGLVQSVGNALWLGQEIERVWGKDE